MLKVAQPGFRIFFSDDVVLYVAGDLVCGRRGGWDPLISKILNSKLVNLLTTASLYLKIEDILIKIKILIFASHESMAGQKGLLHF